MDMKRYLLVRLPAVRERDQVAYISMCEGVWWVAKDAVEAGEGVVVFALLLVSGRKSRVCSTPPDVTEGCVNDLERRLARECGGNEIRLLSKQ
jgi:hypothetical protein